MSPQLTIALGALLAYSATVPVEESCDFVAPKPFLSEHAYKSYAFEIAEFNHARESARLRSHVTLEIQHHSCVDSTGKTLVLTLPRISGKDFDTRYWAAVAYKEIAPLDVAAGNEAALASLMDFLDRIPSLRGNKGQILVCRNGSAPDANGCAWETGGGYLFKLEPMHRMMKISVSEDISG